MKIKHFIMIIVINIILYTLFAWISTKFSTPMAVFTSGWIGGALAVLVPIVIGE